MTPSLYSPGELLARPIEHTLELLSCRKLAAIAGCTRMGAWGALRGERVLTSEEKKRIRHWLASCERDGTVTHPESMEVAVQEGEAGGSQERVEERDGQDG